MTLDGLQDFITECLHDGIPGDQEVKIVMRGGGVHAIASAAPFHFYGHPVLHASQ